MNYYNDFDMNQQPKAKFWRPNEWNASLVQPKKWWYFGVIGPIMALMLVMIILGSYFIAQPDNGSGKNVETYICLIFFGVYGFIITLLLMIYFLILWLGKSQQAFKAAKVFFIMTLILFPFLLIWCSVLNSRMDPPEPEEVFNPYSAANGYGFNPAWASQTRTFALTGQYTGSYAAQPQPQQTQQFGPQPNPQATGMFNVPPRGPQFGPQPNPYAQQQSGMFNVQQRPWMFNVPPRGPQFGPQPNPYAQQQSGMFNVPPRGPQFGPQPNPYAQQQSGMFNVPPRGPQFGPQPNPYAQQQSGMFNAQPQNPQPNPYGQPNPQDSGMFQDPNGQDFGGFDPQGN
ncbi:Uncharacterised protein (plasmid) [Mesomycoplasma conjunctivae]|nr:hypothetical protein [Mycoplasmopsis fermentans]ADV34299.1 Hypothetical Protein MfeM64YM_0295 [Mycoplasmopsis fermentans M64]VEU60323.1 Uncharacterised protein [Mycoplasmopsis fermentans]VEU67465.1 Uncharacterised protein [Mesomycoplasma conjunctivae]